MRPQHWLPPAAWMALILLLSTDLGSAEHTGRLFTPLLRLAWPGASELELAALHALLRKAAHVTEYAVLAALWYRAFRAGRAWRPARAAPSAVGLSVLWALVDEGQQTLAPGRTASLGDVALDATGALVAATVAALGWRRALERATGALLWIAAVGGAATLGLHAALDVPAPWLWVTTPLAILGLLLRARARRGRPP